MKRSGFKSRGKPLQTKSPMRKVSRKKAAKRASSEGQEAARYMWAVKQLPCCICGAAPPSDAHHCYNDRYGTAKESDWDVIPLCKICHQDGPQSVHNAKRTWREKHGPDHGYIEQTAALVLSAFGIDRKGD